MKYIVFELPLLGTCKINSNDENLLGFAKRQLFNYFIEENNNEVNEENTFIDIENSFIANKINSYSDLKYCMSRDFNLMNQTFLLNGISYKIFEEIVRVENKPEINLKKTVKGIYHKLMNRTEEKKYAEISGRYYNNILFPILTIYAAGYGFFCVHGSLVSLKGKNILLTGLDGVGKSTMANEMCVNTQNELLADNIVLFDGKMALNFNMAMRVDCDAVSNFEELYINKNIKEVLPKPSMKGCVKIDEVYNVIMGTEKSNVKILNRSVDEGVWLLYMNKAPEIGAANEKMSTWVYLYNLLYGKEKSSVIPKTIVIPKGKLDEAKEVIENECNIFN